MSASTGCDAALWLCGSEKGRTMSAAVYRFYVGIDWATEKHRVVVLDAERRVVREREVCHEGAALESFADWLTQLAASAVETVAVALEVPRGAVVDVLLARGFHVFALNPKQLDRFRDRFTVAGAKDDRRDAQVLASALATDLATFRRLEPEHPLSSLASKTTCRRNSAASPIGCASNCTATTHSSSTSCRRPTSPGSG